MQSLKLYLEGIDMSEFTFQQLKDMNDSTMTIALNTEMFERHVHFKAESSIFQEDVSLLVAEGETQANRPRVLVSKERYVHMIGKHSSYVLCPYTEILEARVGRLDFDTGRLADKESVCFKVSWANDSTVNMPWLGNYSYFTWEELSWDFTSAMKLREWIKKKGLDVNVSSILHLGKGSGVEGTKAESQTDSVKDQ